MASKSFDFQDVLQLVELIKNSTTFSELRIRSGDLELEVRRGPASSAAPSPSRPFVSDAPVAAAAPLAAAPAAAPSSAAPVTAAPVPAAPRARASHPGATVVTAPMVGTVYRAPEPGATPFVEVGQAIEVGDRLCLIEVMKLMNAIRAECAGTVVDILVADGEAVTSGQDLFVIAPR